MTIRTATTLLVASAVALLSLGIVMLASTSSVRAEELLHDPTFFLRRQVMWLALAGVGAVVASRIEYSWWRRLAIPISLACLFLLVLVFVPHIGVKVGGSHRWLGVGPIRFQPSEAAKIILVVGLAAWMAHIERRATSLKLGLIIPGIGLGLTLVLLIAEPDFGTTMLCATVGGLILFAGGARLSHLAVSGTIALSLFGLAVMHDPLRLGRLLAFLFPEKYPATAYHLMQSKVAFIKGGFLGVGLGSSIQKQFYLPEAHTDFILAIIGEELGLIATLGVVLAFGLILWSGLTISAKAPDAFGRLVAFGLTMMLVLQAAINAGVVTGCLPTKGLPLPFISYGGSSLISALVSVGILLSIARHAAAQPDEISQSVKDRAHAF